MESPSTLSPETIARSSPPTTTTTAADAPNDDTTHDADADADTVRVGRDPPALRLSVSTMEGYELATEAMRGLDLGSPASGRVFTGFTTVREGTERENDDAVTAISALSEGDATAISALAEDSDEEDLAKRAASAGAAVKQALDNATVANMNSLAGEHMKRGEYDRAIVLLEEILKAKKAEHGDGGGKAHRDVGSALHNLGTAHAKSRSFKRALPLCREAVRVRKEALGEDDADVANSLVKLGTVLCSLGKREAALDAHREALRIRRVLHGANDQGVAQILNHVGMIYFEAGESLAALSAFDDALYIQRLASSSTGGNNHEQGETLSNIGTVRMKRQQFHEAVVAFEGAFSIQQYKDGHPALLYTLDCLAFSHAKDGNNREAIKAYKAMLRTQIATHGPAHVECARTLNKISALVEKSGKYSVAYEYTRQALAIEERKLRGNHPALLQTQTNRARLERKIRKQAERARAGRRASSRRLSDGTGPTEC